jgi:hypothetical protein
MCEEEMSNNLPDDPHTSASSGGRHFDSPEEPITDAELERKASTFAKIMSDRTARNRKIGAMPTPSEPVDMDDNGPLDNDEEAFMNEITSNL